MSWALGRAPGSRTTLCTSQVGVWGLLGPGSLGKRDWDVAAPCPSPGTPQQCPGLLGEGQGKDGPGDTWGHVGTVPTSAPLLEGRDGTEFLLPPLPLPEDKTSHK